MNCIKTKKKHIFVDFSQNTVVLFKFKRVQFTTRFDVFTCHRKDIVRMSIVQCGGNENKDTKR